MLLTYHWASPLQDGFHGNKGRAPQFYNPSQQSSWYSPTTDNPAIYTDNELLYDTEAGRKPDYWLVKQTVDWFFIISRSASPILSLYMTQSDIYRWPVYCRRWTCSLLASKVIWRWPVYCFCGLVLFLHLKSHLQITSLLTSCRQVPCYHLKSFY